MTPDNPVYALISDQAATDALPRLFAAKKNGLEISPDGGKSWQAASQSLGLPLDLPALSFALAANGPQKRLFVGLAGGILLGTPGAAPSAWEWQSARFSSPLPAVSALAISPAFAADGVMLAATLQDGVLRSSDHGQSWHGWNFNLLDWNVLCLALSPAFPQDQVAFAGTSSGLFRSHNGGRSWVELALPGGNEAILSLGISPNFREDGRLWAGSETEGVLTSTNGGDTWERLPLLPPATPVNAIGCFPQSASRWQLALLTDSDLWIGFDQGTAWHRMPLPLPAEASPAALHAPYGFEAGQTFWVGLSTGQVLTCLA